MSRAWIVICLASGFARADQLGHPARHLGQNPGPGGTSPRSARLADQLAFKDLQLHWDPDLLHRLATPPQRPKPNRWVHPLGGPERALPLKRSRKFGAHRPFRRPPECRAGHCGVDLGSTRGDPVFAIHDGIVERIERDETKDLKSGRYVRIGHQAGKVVSRYIHLDSIREDLHEGDRVSSGEQIGRLGSTGIFNSGPHLHFSLSLRERGGERYLDPEPFLLAWDLPTGDKIAAAPAPAPPQAVAQPAARWMAEHWEWSGRRWEWVPAAWRVPRPGAPRTAAYWVPAHWFWNGVTWIWIGGGWRVQTGYMPG
jgi:murein DD-endopeptidase MepM/ murein hydrolase activator NlpD